MVINVGQYTLVLLKIHFTLDDKVHFCGICIVMSPIRNNDSQNSNRVISPPPFYTKRPTRNLPKMSKPEFLPKRKSYNKITIDNSKQVTQNMTHPSLPHYTNVTSKSDNTETETPVKNYSKTNYSFPPSF